jgi:uncharacterized alkaline shock family protein YloU
MAELKHIEGELGEIFISEGVVRSIIELISSDLKGLKAFNQVEEEGIFGAISKAYKGDGIEIKKEGELLKIRLSLIAEYGIPIPKSAGEAIKKIRKTVRELAGLEVSEVEIEIKGLKVR